ncbi:restriction endonuclease subunit S [Vibrio vulnificus]|nr:restriction endonuclease subunit S [Vibrio vulnificus]ELG5190933.1 restriction endonuclease subunit S [Vibrio vulnificus]ELH4810846.1 restriction endonuclease subunit S [Vibrio vulnificus]MCU8219869.1 restriction endonuclease subunit S [Vibrio vulnificus]HAS6399392.1 restriction endonuclease subunit S [Vibrio vulnificus]
MNVDYIPVTECFNIGTGKLNSNAAVDGGEYPFFTCSKEASSIDKYAFDQEALLLAGNNAQGQYDVKYYNGKFNAYQRTYVLSLKSDSHSYSYFKYALQAQLELLKASSKGTNTKYITMEILGRVLLPVPCPSEQQRIAAILDKADAIRQKRKQAIDLADEFLRSVFLDMFGDPVTNPKGFSVGTIRDIVSTVNYGTSGKASETDGEFPILRMGNITYKGGWDFSDLKYIDLDDKDQGKYLARKNDLLFNRTNSKELVGKTAVFNESRPMAIAGYLVRVRTNELGNPWYISGYLNSSHGKQTLLNMCKSIVGMANINAQELQDIKILLPPVELQNKYESIVKEVTERASRHHESVKELQVLFNALSQKAFSGQL